MKNFLKNSIFLIGLIILTACGGYENDIDVQSSTSPIFTEYLTPNANAQIQLTRLAFTNSNIENVDDVDNCDGLNTYNYATALNTGLLDTYRVPLWSIDNGRVITDIRIVPCASKYLNQTGFTYFELFYRWNGVESTHSVFQLDSYVPTQFGTLYANWGNLNYRKESNSYIEIGIKYIGCPAQFCSVDALRGMRVSRMTVRFAYQ